MIMSGKFRRIWPVLRNLFRHMK